MAWVMYPISDILKHKK